MHHHSQSILAMSVCRSEESLQVLSMTKEELVSKLHNMQNSVSKAREETRRLENRNKYLEEVINSLRKNAEEIGGKKSFLKQETSLKNETEDEEDKRKKINESIREVTKHDYRCNAEFGLEDREVEASQEQFQPGWRVVDLFDEEKEWFSWDAMCPPPSEQEDYGVEAEWMFGARLDQAFTGILRIKPGHSQPCHRHKLPEIYYILQVYTLTVNNNKQVEMFRAAPW